MKQTSALLTAAVLIMSACQQQAEHTSTEALPNSPIAATVNGSAIYERDINQELAAMPESLQQYRENPQARSHILHTLIRRHVVSQKAVELGLDLDPLVRQRIEKARRQILIDAARSWQHLHMPRIEEAAIQAYYDSHSDDFTVAEQIHARHILVSTEKQAKAILRKLRHRGDFSALAASQSLDDSNKSRGGDLNWFPRGVMVQPFEDAAFALEPNTLSAPVKTKFGWHIIEVLSKRPSSKKALADVRDEIISQLQQAQMQNWFSKLEQEAHINLMPPYRSEDTPSSLQQGGSMEAGTK